MRPDLYLMRHGQTLWNRDGRLQGRRDSALTALGLRQAAWLADLSADIVAAVRVSSPLGRALQTAEIAFDGSFGTDPRLVEIDVGDFTGRRVDDLQRQYPTVFDGGALDWYDRCPGGEGFAALERRCRAFLDDLRGPALVMTHGVTLRMLRVLALGQPVAWLDRGAVHQGAIHAIRRGNETLLRHRDDAPA